MLYGTFESAKSWMASQFVHDEDWGGSRSGCVREAERSCQILADNTFGLEDSFIFQQDNNLKQTAKAAQKGVQKRPKVNILESPSQSPHLRPVFEFVAGINERERTCAQTLSNLTETVFFFFQSVS